MSTMYAPHTHTHIVVAAADNNDADNDDDDVVDGGCGVGMLETAGAP